MPQFHRTAAAFLAAATIAAASPAIGFAGELAEGDQVIELQEWRQMTEGRTVHYSLAGRHWGREYFHADRDSATFVSADGDCVTAPWVYADGVFCFSYTGMDCFRHVRRGDMLLALPLGDGAEQVIERITTEPLSCEPPLSS
ncbi:hypothetical protein [Rubrimonas cliftonensis]|uniref:Secreted protein n=1 Tax=Rubrimonas cliftonensis TaxID=89524 RepID=A0A1H4DSU8_9RHOB|nr:hypothetical protein [Rubrimonas cliftonensis]SEA75490.1 hypothetical protein SAMN05444370_1116 [Rubrimonas cliftonensis]